MSCTSMSCSPRTSASSRTTRLWCLWMLVLSGVASAWRIGEAANPGPPGGAGLDDAEGSYGDISDEDLPVPEDWAGESLEEKAVRCSTRERIAEAAERESVDLKKAEYMERHLGDEFTGTISGVTSFGLFVLLDEVFVEGLVHVNSMMDDYYAFQEDSYRLVGERSRRTFRLGDRLAVRVSRVDKLERFIDFVLVDSRPIRR